jgi:hypothetical protein
MVLLVLSGCITHREFPVYDITVIPSTDAAGIRLAGEARRIETVSDLNAIDAVLQSVGFQVLASHPHTGKPLVIPCMGYLDILRVYRLTDATGVYVGSRLKDGPLVVAMIDTGERGASYSEEDRVIFSQLIEKLDGTFGTDRVSVPKQWGEGFIWCKVSSGSHFIWE